jgi:hypothetical protein
MEPPKKRRRLADILAEQQIQQVGGASIGCTTHAAPTHPAIAAVPPPLHDLRP